MPTKTLRIATLISGSGRTVVNLHEAIDRDVIPAEIVLCISSRSDVAGVQRAKDLGIETKVVERKGCDSPAEFSDVIWQHLREANVDLICLCGFMSFLPIPDDQLGKVVNIHPSLLPKFGGKGMFGHHVHEAVIAAGEAESGCTVHFADNVYDHGPTILQRKIDVLPNDTPDTLAARVFDEECKAYPEAVRLIAEGLATYTPAS